MHAGGIQFCWRVCVALGLAVATPVLAADDFANFESAQVHPLALSADRTWLYAINTPDNRLSIFEVALDGSLALDAEIVVGLEPVSLAVRGDEVWVVNHLSDSVSVVDASERRVVATIHTGDEPTDVVFAGSKAFVGMAGGRDQVKVYDAATRAELAQIDVFGDDPRALAVSSDASEVYLVVLESGNRTTTVVPESDGGTLPPPSPPKRPGIPASPARGLIVKFNPATEAWEDEYGGFRGDLSKVDVPDHDIFVIDVTTMQVERTIRSVGTTLYDVAVQPGSGNLFVVNTDARNLIRFEPNLRGHFLDTRLTSVVAASGDRTHFDLNPHVDYDVSPGPAAEIEASVAIPLDVEFMADGSACYVASFGSRKVVRVDPSDGSIDQRISVGGGPSGLALAENTGRLYVLDRFDNAISIVDTNAGAEISRVGIAGPTAFDPSPDVIRAGRPFLYDAGTTSGHGDLACASCHVFGNFDGIAWDLGDPRGELVNYVNADWIEFLEGETPLGFFHPMKGPMVTQTLRGLDDMEPFHWRGDRRNFQHFNGAFVSLMGLDAPIADEQMDRFADFAMTIRMPPNPYRTLDDGLPSVVPVLGVATSGGQVDGHPADGARLYFDGTGGDGPRACIECHKLPNGTDNKLNRSLLMPQDMKVAQLRNVYEKVAYNLVTLGSDQFGAPQQKSGFGILHDGAVSFAQFLFGYFFGQEGVTIQDEYDVAAFVLSFPSGTPPITGHQLTIDHENARSPESDARLALLLDQAALGNCDVVVHGVVGGQARSFVYDSEADRFAPDSRVESPVEDIAIRSSLVAGDVITYMAVPTGSGFRMGLDRDRDTWLDADELVAGSDATDIESTPIECRANDNESLVDVKMSVRTSRTNADEASLSARGKLDLRAHKEPAIDLAATGMILAIRDQFGEVVHRRRIRATSVIETATGSWKLREGSEPGVEKMKVRDKDGVYSIQMKLAVESDILAGVAFPIEAITLLGGADQDEAGQCGRATFESDDCRSSSSKTSCR